MPGHRQSKKTATGPAEASPYPWDMALEELGPLFVKPWGKPLGRITTRQEAATFFAMRSGRRVGAIDALFRLGLYNEAYPLVRAGYEDWLTLAYILQAEGPERWVRFRAETRRIDARVYEAFKALCGAEAAADHFGALPPEVSVHLGVSRREAARTGWPGWSTLAESVGLSDVHSYVYTRLSAYSHPTGRSFDAVFESAPGKVTARTPQRDAEEEFQLALWALWFELRLVTLGLSEFGIDEESRSDEWLTLRDTHELATCVLVREDLHPQHRDQG